VSRFASLARLKRLSRGERQLLYRLTKKMAGEEIESDVPGYVWRVVRKPGESAGAALPRVSIVYERPDEPELDAALPLAEASRRLALGPRRDEAREVDVDVIPTPEQALRALREAKTARDAHDVDDERHRSVCRACRLAWRDRPVESASGLRGRCGATATSMAARAPAPRAAAQSTQGLAAEQHRDYPAG